MTGKLSRFSLPLILVLLLQGPLFSSEKTIHPTFAKETSVQVSRGGEVEISLEAIPSYGNPIVFQIQDTALHGSLSFVTNTSDHTAKVIYHHDGSREPLQDEFSFRAQAPGRAKSSATRVSIAIIPPPALLVFEPSELNFGSLILSEKRQTSVVIRNIGGSKTKGRLVLPNGFSAPEGDAYSLDEGESVPMIVEFHPQEERSFSAEANTLPFLEEEPLRLTGTGLSQFELSKPDPLTCLVKNLSGQSLRISFSGDLCWIMPQETLVPPHAEKAFFFQQAETEEETPFSAQSSVVHVSDGFSSRSFELPPPRGFIPLSVRAVTDSSLGMMPLGASLPVKFSLLNRSEFPKRVLWSATSPSGGGSSSESLVELRGGEAKEITFPWMPSLPGGASLKITIQEGTKTSHELLWSVTMNTTASEVSSPIGSEQNNNTPESVAGDSSSENFPHRQLIPTVSGVSWRTETSWLGKTRLLLQWDIPPSSDSQITLEERRIMITENPESPTGSQLLSKYPSGKVESVPVESSREQRRADHVEVQLSKLQPGPHLIVVSRISKEGTLEEQSQLQVHLPPRAPWWSIWRVPLGVLVLLPLIAFLRNIRG